MKDVKRKVKRNLSIIVVCACVIMIWRAVRDLCDLFIFPDNKVLSDLVCLIIWIIILLLDDGELKELL